MKHRLERPNIIYSSYEERIKPLREQEKQLRIDAATARHELKEAEALLQGLLTNPPEADFDEEHEVREWKIAQARGDIEILKKSAADLEAAADATLAEINRIAGEDMRDSRRMVKKPRGIN